MCVCTTYYLFCTACSNACAPVHIQSARPLSLDWSQRHSNIFFYCSTLAFECVALSRNIQLQIYRHGYCLYKKKGNRKLRVFNGCLKYPSALLNCGGNSRRQDVGNQSLVNTHLQSSTFLHQIHFNLTTVSVTTTTTFLWWKNHSGLGVHVSNYMLNPSQGSINSEVKRLLCCTSTPRCPQQAVLLALTMHVSDI